MQCPRGLVGVAALGISFVLSGPSVALDVTPSGSSDAVAHRLWYPGYNSYWVDSENSASLSAYWDTSGWYTSDRWWDVPVLEFPLAGVVAGPATLNFYVSAAGSGPMVVRYAGGDDNGVVEAGDWLNIGTDVGAFDGTSVGWRSLDVTSQVQQSLDSGHAWAVFTIRSNEWWAGTTIAASESGSFSPFIHAVPEPSVVALLGTGTACLMFYGWRKWRKPARPLPRGGVKERGHST